LDHHRALFGDIPECHQIERGEVRREHPCLVFQGLVENGLQSSRTGDCETPSQTRLRQSPPKRAHRRLSRASASWAALPFSKRGRVCPCKSNQPAGDVFSVPERHRVAPIFSTRWRWFQTGSETSARTSTSSKSRVTGPSL